MTATRSRGQAHDSDAAAGRAARAARRLAAVLRAAAPWGAAPRRAAWLAAAPRRALPLAAALLAAGCGATAGGSASAPAPRTFVDVVKADNAICGGVGTKVARIAPPNFTPSSVSQAKLATARSYLDRVLPLLQDEYAQIAAVKRPASMTASQRALYTQVLGALTTMLDDERAARNAAAAGSLVGFKASLNAQRTDSQRLTGLAVQTGLTTCAGG